jgi:hypothetical protein
MNTNTKTIVALAAVVAISAILVGSVLANDAMAKRCHYRGHNNGGGDRSQSISQAAVSGNGGQSQNVANQQQGNGNSAAVVGIQNRD